MGTTAPPLIRPGAPDDRIWLQHLRNNSTISLSGRELGEPQQVGSVSAADWNGTRSGLEEYPHFAGSRLRSPLELLPQRAGTLPAVHWKKLTLKCLFYTVLPFSIGF